MSEALTLAKNLIARESITPEDKGCQAFIADYLSALGFECQHLPSGPVQNLWATIGHANIDNKGPLMIFAGHTDVVPPGPLAQWDSPPFTPEIRNNTLYGRGAADMKSSLAAMLVAAKQWLNTQPNQGRLAFLITSDEEGEAIHGTKTVVDWLQQQNIRANYCIVGEASSEQYFGDTIKIGRRGSLSAKLTVKGLQGHIAYPQLAKNAIHHALPFLNELIAIQWDTGNDYFPPTSLQLSNIHGGTGANNVIPGECEILFNLRYSPAITAAEIQNKIEGLARQHLLDYAIHWHHSGKPFLTQPGKLTETIQQILLTDYQVSCQSSTAGGTSDGRFIIDVVDELVELGPINASIHQVNEHINLADLEKLTQVYTKILKHLLG